MSRLNVALPDPVARLTHNVRAVLGAADRTTALRFGAALLRNVTHVIASRSLRPVDEAMSGGAVAFTVDGTKIILDGRDFAGAREMYCRKVYLSHPNVHLGTDGNVVDLGANVGLFTLLAALRGAHVVAVEAQRGFVKAVEARLEENGCAERVAIDCALIGGGVGVFARPEDLVRASHYEPEQATPVISMEELVERHGLETIDFLKADIEGAEFRVFERPAQWMRGVRQIAMEVHPKFGDTQALVSVLREVGMTVETFDDFLRPTPKPGERGGYLFAWRPQ